jgi:hypothetical protein
MKDKGAAQSCPLQHPEQRPKPLSSKSRQNAGIKVQNDRANAKSFVPMESGSCHFDF